VDKEFNHSRYWVVWFYDLESWTKFRLATNLPAEEFSNGEIGDIYDCHWQIELLWKFLKMHLELRQRCSVIHWSYDFLPEALVH
jgi:IS4 transposase